MDGTVEMATSMLASGSVCGKLQQLTPSDSSGAAFAGPQIDRATAKGTSLA